MRTPTVPLADAIWRAAQAAGIPTPDITRDDRTGLTVIVLALPVEDLHHAPAIRTAVLHSLPGSAIGYDTINRPELISFYMCGGQSVAYDGRIVHATADPLMCIHPECDLPARTGFPTCRWESCEAFAATRLNGE